MELTRSMLSRRRLLALAGAAGGALTVPLPAFGGVRAQAADPVADLYRNVLLAHTRWVERQWDPAIGAYRAADFRFAVVLGNAVLLTSEGYDAQLAGVDAATLRARTLATIRRYATTNRLVGGADWGKQLFWDSTFELYFVLAARLLWAYLDGGTRSAVDRMARGSVNSSPAHTTHPVRVDDRLLDGVARPVGGLRPQRHRARSGCWPSRSPAVSTSTTSSSG